MRLKELNPHTILLITKDNHLSERINLFTERVSRLTAFATTLYVAYCLKVGYMA